MAKFRGLSENKSEIHGDTFDSRVLFHLAKTEVGCCSQEEPQPTPEMGWGHSYTQDVVGMDNGQGGALRGLLSETRESTALLSGRLGFGPPSQTGRFPSSWCLFD